MVPIFRQHGPNCWQSLFWQTIKTNFQQKYRLVPILWPGGFNSPIALCKTLWPEQHFTTTSLQNNATDSVSKIKLQKNVCILVSFWLICITKIVGLDKFLDRKHLHISATLYLVVSALWNSQNLVSNVDHQINLLRYSVSVSFKYIGVCLNQHLDTVNPNGYPPPEITNCNLNANTDVTL